MSSGKKKKRRPNISAKIKLALYREAGNKCANPGCANTLVEFHHIKEWHVYQTHDKADMVAVCPTCHTHAHYGQLKIDDATIRYWKSILRSATRRGHLYVEPGETCRVLLGSIYLTNGRSLPQGATVFRLSPRNQLSFRVADGDLLLMNLVMTDTSGHEILRVLDGHVKHQAEDPVRYESRPGRCRVTAPAIAAYLPEWVQSKYSERPPESLIQEGMFTLLDLEVLDRGLVQVQGVWAEDQRAVVITRDWLSPCLVRTNGFTHIRGYGDYRGEPKNLKKLPLFQYEGPIEYSVLGAMLRSGEL